MSQSQVTSYVVWAIALIQLLLSACERSDFERADYSRDVDKRELGNALQKFVGEFMEGGGSGDAIDTFDNQIYSNEPPLTPIDTIVSSEDETPV